MKQRAIALPTLLPLPGNVDIWYAALDQPRAVVAQMEESLAPDEWARLRRFHFAADARRYAVRRGLLRHLLGRYLNVGPSDVAFVYGVQNKPALAAPLAETDLHFNLSDSGEMAIYAFAVGLEIGVDIEAHKEYPDAEELAARFFSPDEAQWMGNQPKETISLAFLRCWIGKEAVVKALGDGLMAPLQEFTVAHWQSPPRLIWPGVSPAKWCIHQLNPPPGYSASLATPGLAISVSEKILEVPLQNF